jgi:hypothetical protein
MSSKPARVRQRWMGHHCAAEAPVVFETEAPAGRTGSCCAAPAALTCADVDRGPRHPVRNLCARPTRQLDDQESLSRTTPCPANDSRSAASGPDDRTQEHADMIARQVPVPADGANVRMSVMARSPVAARC